MSELFGDLIAIGGDPISVARTYTARELRASLAQLTVGARTVGEQERWRDALPLGCTGRTGRGFGTELSPSPLAGMGFWRDYFLSPVHLEAGYDEDIAVELRMREREVTAVEKVWRESSVLMPVPVEVRTGVATDSVTRFEEGVRRRLAYALAFEATIAAGSFEPLTTRHEVLVRGRVSRRSTLLARWS